MNDMETCIADVTTADREGLIEAQRSYGDSWKKRGGVGAFMNVCRKWDRLDVMLSSDSEPRPQYDIFRAIEQEVKNGTAGEDKVLDAVRDLRRYLVLVEAEMMRHLGALPLQRDNKTSQARRTGHIDNTGQKTVRSLTLPDLKGLMQNDATSTSRP
jgi:hypothetical protein